MGENGGARISCVNLTLKKKKKTKHCPNLFLRRERQYSICSSEDSPGSCEVLYFSMGSPDQLMVYKGKCIGE